MGEAMAGVFRGLGFQVSLDEPYQHYQFAGRGDVVVVAVEQAAFMHIEDRTRFPDLQDAFGSFNAKRCYLGSEIAARHGIRRWQSETHVIAALWSGECLRSIRAHRGSFAAVCPDPPDAFEQWWAGEPPAQGRHSALVVFDPQPGQRRDRRRWLGLAEVEGARPRYRDYADAAEAFRRIGWAG